MFTTQDKDNDVYSIKNCAVEFKGGWWYNKCHCSNLNGLYQGGSHAQGVVWHSFSSQWYFLKHVEMKFRPNWDSSTSKKPWKLTRLVKNRPHEGRFWKSRNWPRPTDSSAPIRSKLFQLSMPTKSWVFFLQAFISRSLSCLSFPHHSLFWSFYAILYVTNLHNFETTGIFKISYGNFVTTFASLVLARNNNKFPMNFGS